MKDSFTKFRGGIGVLALLLTGGLSATASTEINGLYYDLKSSDKTATVTYENTTETNYSKLSRDLVIPEKVTYSGTEYTVTSIADKAFANCTSLESISIPGSVTSIGTKTTWNGDIYGTELPFYNCTSLKKVNFEDGNSELTLSCHNGGGASNTSQHLSYNMGMFYYCPLEEVYLGRNIQYKENYTYSFFSYPAFYGYSAFYNQTKLKKVTIGENVTSLPQYIFKGCSGLSYVEFGLSLVSIPKQAFYGCSSLTAVNLPSTTISIEENAFYNCSMLRSVSIPGVTQIGTGAFYNNTSLSALELSSSLEEIGSSAFYNATSLLSVSLPSTLKKLGISAFENSSLTDINIPSSVTNIDASCFKGSKIKKAFFGESNITIGSSIFENCEKLEDVTISSGQKEIPGSCFSGCTSLRNISLNEGLTSIADKAFANCTSLESISIPGSVISIGTSNNWNSRNTEGTYLPFYNCTSLKKVSFEDGNSELTLTCHNYSSGTETGYDKGMFYYCPLEEIYLGRDIHYKDERSYPFSSYYRFYGYSAFYNQTKLKKVTIGENVTSLPQYIFKGCSNISSIISLSKDPANVGANGFDNYSASLYYHPLGSSNYSTISPWSEFANNYAMHSENNLIFIPVSDAQVMVAKYPGSSPESISIPESVTTGGKVLSVTKVMECSFADCENLTNVTFPSSVVEIGEGAFARNEKLASITFNGQKIIGKNAFSGCSSITTLTLPSTLEEIGERAFYNIPSLTQVSFGDNLKTIGKEAFASCGSLTAARMPNTLETIETSAFENCFKLTYISLGTSLRNLENRTFFNCKVLTEIEIPGTATTVGNQAFENCENLALATLNSGIVSIGANCFKNCGNLTTMSIPGSVTTIGEGAFDDCTLLSSVSFLAGEEDLWIPYFSDSPIRTLRIGRNLKYSFGETGSPFRNKTTINRVSFTGNFVTNLYNNLFDGCSGITSIALPNTLKTIDAYVFHKCTGLIDIEIPEGVTKIGNNSFENCTKLANVSLPASLEIIEPYLFHNCISLAHIDLKEGLSTIKTHAFDMCESLEDMTIPGTTTLIEDFNFEGCKSLKDLVFKESNNQITLQTTRSLFRDCPLESIYVGRNIDYSYETPSNVPFYQKGLLKDVTFSENDNLTTILPYFIYGANALPSLIIPDNIISAGRYAFANCSSMESIFLSNSLPSIEEGLLQNCSSLKSLVIPSSVMVVNNYALGGCSTLSDLRISDSQETMTANISATSKGMCRETALETLYVGRNIDYQATSTDGYSPFYDISTLKNVTFNMSGNISNLGDYYLYKCSAVESLDLPESLITIGTYALADMTSLEHCRMRNNVTNVGSYGFAYDSSLTDLIFSNKVSTLNNNLFYSCSSLPRFTIYPAVTAIQNNVFTNCTSLADVTFENSSDNLQIARKYENGTYSSLFADCPIETLYLGRWLIYEIGNESWSPFYSQTRLVNLILGETVGDIGKFLFEKCSSLEKVEIPGVESIGEKSFYECSKLSDVTYNFGTRSLGEYAFSECLSLDNVKLPSSVVSISDGCFMNCVSLNTVDMGSSLEIIGPSAFSGCMNLMNADIPETVYGLGVESFKDCVSLPYVNIPKGLSSVGARAFQGCNGAEWLTLSERCTSLGANSFDGCNAIRYIKSYNQNPPVGLPNFATNVIDNATVFVPEVALDDYIDADIWWEFFIIKPMTDSKFVSYLNLDKKEATLKASQTVQLIAEAGPSDAADTSIGFVSDNNDVATVDADGLVTAVKVGEANIKAYAKDGSGFYQICKIIVEPTLVERIDLSAGEMTLRVNRSGKISADVYPATTTNKEITWSSSNKGVATIDENGNISTIYDGETILKAQANDSSGVIATCTLTVEPPLAGDSNDNDNVTISDAVNTANYAVGKDVEVFNFRAADINNDNRITVSDASGTVTIILDQVADYSQIRDIAIKRMAGLDNYDTLSIDEIAIAKGMSAEFEVMLNDSREFVALQADLIAPEGTIIEDVRLGNRVVGSHSLILKRFDERSMRVVLFDINNSAFVDMDEALFIVTLKNNNADAGNIIIDNILASDVSANEYELSCLGGVFYGNTTGIVDPSTGNIMINTKPGEINIFNAEGRDVKIYMPDGTQIAGFKAETDMESFKAAPGIYLVVAGDKSVKVLVK